MSEQSDQGIIDLTDDDDNGAGGVPVIDLTDADDNATPLRATLPQSTQHAGHAAPTSRNQLWRAGVETLHKVANPQQVRLRSRSHLSTAQTQGLLRAFGVFPESSDSAASSSTGIREPVLRQLGPLPSFADLFRAQQVPVRAISAPSNPDGLTGPTRTLPTPVPPAATEAPQSATLFNFNSFRDTRSTPSSSPESLPLPPASLQAPQTVVTASRSHGHFAIGADGLILPNSPQHTFAGTATNPILLADDSEEVSVPQLPTNVRPSTAQSELLLFSDGSVIRVHANTFGGCGVAYSKNGHWSGRAIALGPLRDSGRAELHGIYQAYRLAAEILRPDHRFVTIYTDCSGLIDTIGGAIKGRTGGDELLRSIVEVDRGLSLQGAVVQIRWVKGHSVSAGNQMADLLAGLASQKASLGLGGQSWDDPDLGMVAIGRDEMRHMSNRAKKTVAKKLDGDSVDAYFLRAERRKQRLASRRAHRLAKRAGGNIRSVTPDVFPFPPNEDVDVANEKTLRSGNFYTISFE